MKLLFLRKWKADAAFSRRILPHLAKSARDDVITIAYSWEYYIRTEKMQEDKDVIKEGWVRESDSMPNLHLDDYYSRATNAPGTIKNRYEGSINLVKSAAKVKEFITIYSRAVNNKVEAKYLPGSRPPSAPPAAEK